MADLASQLEEDARFVSEGPSPSQNVDHAEIEGKKYDSSGVSGSPVPKDPEYPTQKVSRSPSQNEDHVEMDFTLYNPSDDNELPLYNPSDDNEIPNAEDRSYMTEESLSQVIKDDLDLSDDDTSRKEVSPRNSGTDKKNHHTVAISETSERESQETASSSQMTEPTNVPEDGTAVQSINATKRSIQEKVSHTKAHHRFPRRSHDFSLSKVSYESEDDVPRLGDEDLSDYNLVLAKVEDKLEEKEGVDLASPAQLARNSQTLDIKPIVNCKKRRRSKKMPNKKRENPRRASKFKNEDESDEELTNCGLTCEEAWAEKFSDLEKFKAKEGNCDVPQKFSKDGELGRWVHRQRREYKNLLDKKRSSLNEKKILALQSIGFLWSIPVEEIIRRSKIAHKVYCDRKWTENFDHLVQFQAMEGHCNVPQKFKGNLKLGRWINKQRQEYALFNEEKKSSLNQERLDKLTSIGFTWSISKEEFNRCSKIALMEHYEIEWYSKLERLRQFKVKEGHCNVPQKFVDGELKLGRWVNRQRANFKTLSDGKVSALNAVRKKLLEDIGFSWSVKSPKI